MKPVIAGNWKMNLTPREAAAFMAEFDASDLPVEALVFPTALCLSAVIEGAASASVAVGVQNVHWEPSGAFTGEISAELAAASGASHALVGHSERRHVFGETDEMVARKVTSVLAAGLIPVVCVGETLDERRAGQVDQVITRQLDAILGSVDRETRWMLAYEPVWAIGTGETATPADASSAHGTLRVRLEEALGIARATRVPLLYGGSVKPGNAEELLAASDVDGVLVGGASLDPESYAQIIAAAG